MIRTALAAAVTAGLSLAGVHVAAAPHKPTPACQLASHKVQVALADEATRINEHPKPITESQALSDAIRTRQIMQDSILATSLIQATC